MKVFLLSFFIFSNIHNSTAQLYYHYDNEVRLIYEDIISLKFERAHHSISSYPDQDNLALVHLKSYIDFFSLFINENKDLYNQVYHHKEKYLDQLAAGDSDSPYHKFIKAEILLQWALIDIKFDKKLKAGKAIFQAYKLLESNKDRFPLFIENNKSLSVIHVLARSLPSWVKTLLGIEGSLAMGRREILEIKDFALKNPSFFFREEVAAINSYILFYQTNEKPLAMKDLEAFNLEYKSSPLLAFLKASMALRNGNNNDCIKILESCITDKEQSPFYYLDFMLGRSLLFARDKRAKQYLLNYVNSFEGQHFIKEAYQKLAWFELILNDNLDGYYYYMELCERKGNSLVDEDKQALREAELKSAPNTILLEARLLFDGGYYHQAFNFLQANSEIELDNEAESIEFNYRMGRTLQALGRTKESLLVFANVIDASKGESKHYKVGNAALQMGLIYEELGDYNSAKYYYDYCLNQDFDLYKNSIEQKAKSGLQRIKDFSK